MSEHIHNSDRITGSVGEARHHDSALKHVTGQARYVDDIAVPNGTLHLAVGGCDTTAGDIIAMNLDAVRNAPGVVAVLTADDIAGTNDVSPLHLGDDPILADKQVRFHGEAVFAVLAQSYRAARAAARLGHIETTQATPVVPEPIQLSKTKSPLLLYVLIRYSIRATGFCVGCIALSNPNSIISDG